MSSDNGFMIRKNNARKFVLQEYSASADELPSVENPNAKTFDYLEEAVRYYADLTHNQDYPCEYGLSIDLGPRLGTI